MCFIYAGGTRGKIRCQEIRLSMSLCLFGTAVIDSGGLLPSTQPFSK